MTTKFNKGDRVVVKESGCKAVVYDNENFLGENKVLIRFNGRHSLDLFNESELEKIQ